MTDKVTKCIEIARSSKLVCLKHDQANLKLKTDELHWRWEPCMQGKFFQVLTAPIVYPALLLFIVFDYQISRAKFKRQIKKMENGSVPTSTDQSFASLWDSYGLNKNYPDSERLKVLEQWITILYPERLADFTTKKNELIAKSQKYPDISQAVLVDEIKLLIKDLKLADYQS